MKYTENNIIGIVFNDSWLVQGKSGLPIRNLKTGSQPVGFTLREIAENFNSGRWKVNKEPKSELYEIY